MFDDDSLCTIRPDAEPGVVDIIDQTLLPHTLRWRQLVELVDFEQAIADMWVRGAPLIGVTAAYGLARCAQQDASDYALQRASERLLATRPTAVNLRWALQRMQGVLVQIPMQQRPAAAVAEAHAIRAADIDCCDRIGRHGLELLRQLHRSNPDRAVQVMTHCNAGWLATVQWGTALAPIYHAAREGIPVHVWVSETRPRNQGASLTAWELQQAGVDYTLVSDNACGHLLASGRVDTVLVGSDRTAANGDVCNKIGTYLKALACAAHNVPFYVALPMSTVDWQCETGRAIPIENRQQQEVLQAWGRDGKGKEQWFALAPEGCEASNPAFDVTPAVLVSGLVTEFGVFGADRAGMAALRSAGGLQPLH